MFNHFKSTYYKIKIVATFSVVTILLVAVLAKVSYDFTYDFYLNQLTENVKQTTSLTVSNIRKEYLPTLKSGIFTETIKNYFNNFLGKEEFNKIYSELFIFDKNFKVLVHSNSQKLINVKEPRLYLSENEIFKLRNNQIATSLPFKGNDNNWYLWGFYRFSNDYWLAVRASASSFESIDNLSKIIWYFGFVGIAISIFLGFVIANSITKPIDKLVDFSTKIGKGNLKASPPTKMKGELKILSDALIAMRQNIASNQEEKDKILAQIAHEIRNPLGGIELLTNLINESLEENNKNREYARRILNEISGLKELITSYLNFSKPTASVPEKIDIKEVINESISMLGNEISKYNIKVKSNYEINNIFFDKIHFRNIILNLLKNSIESIKKNGEITINAFNRNGSNYITISDNGKGILKENLDKIFDPFFTTKNNGTGLGLSACRKFCEENNARLEVENLEQGCMFSIIKNKENEEYFSS